ncbi:MAG TPA: metallopeptidase TldD-related protein [Candidatus Methylomirabilis sp.]|nr:metallopeptidase TldD-related protein [Candidatus Methylomirabilis sp.]
MTTRADLKVAVEEGLRLLTAQPEIREAEVFAALNRHLITRLSYTSHIPCNGVEEPKSTEAHGLGIRVVLDAPDGPRIGFGSEPSDLGPAGVRRALDKARAAAVRDPEFRSLPRPGGERRALSGYHDPGLLAIDDTGLVEVGWRVVSGGLRAFAASSRLADLAGGEERRRRLGLILSGDVSILQERIAIASTHMPEAQTDESTLITSFATAMVEASEAKGSGWTTGTRLDHFTEEAGSEAALNAIAAMDGKRVATGDYTVIFGRQPVADLLNNLVVPAVRAGAFYASSSPFLGKLGSTVAAPLLTIYDHGAMPGLTGSKGITCEGLPTGRTDLIRGGVLVGLLSDWYDTQRLLGDPALVRKLGTRAEEAGPALVPRNGFRYDGGGRSFELPPRTAASNIVVEGADPTPREALIARIERGLYIGRIWYTYPINGLAKGDFTCTVVGDSHVIRDGRLAAPLAANSVRINDNITRLLQHITGVTGDARGTVVWAADEVVYAPEIAVAGVHVDAVGGTAGRLP